jgi:hypothetical protein
VSEALEAVMRQHLARMDQIGAKGVEVTNKWASATAVLAERFSVDVGQKIAAVVLDDPKPAEPETSSPVIKGVA